MNLLSVTGVSKQREQDFFLDAISFEQPKLRRIAIAGETGSGKSTLLQIIAGLGTSDTGEVLFENKKVLGSDRQLIPGHPEIAYLSQYFELRNHYRVEELLEMASRIPARLAKQLFEICRISHLLKRKNDQLSGGEKQRIALARVLVATPKLLILDEPFSNLDLIHKDILKAIIADIGNQLEITILLASHDPLDTLSWAEEMIVLRQGKIVQHDSPEHLYRRPVNEYVAGLFGRYNLIPPGKTGLFVERTGITNARKSLLIRPEALTLNMSPISRLKGVVSRSRFMGGYYEVDVNVAGMNIVAHSRELSWQPGTTVGLGVTVKGLWYL
jgi:ABC-type sugar transport system ATPase subunit